MATKTLSILSAAILMFSGAVVAQTDYPSKPVRFIVPYPPGGNTDVLARMLGQGYSEAWGHQFIMDNRPGAGGTLGTGLVAHATPDGYTIGMGSFGSVIIARQLYPKLDYEPLRDLVPIVLASTPPGILVANPGLPARTVAELIKYAKSNPGKLNYGSPGVGAWNHLFFELFKEKAKVDIVHVPYKGVAFAVTDLIAGQVQLVMSPFPTAMPHVLAGRLRALAVTSIARSKVIPDVPTIDESGLPGYSAVAWFALVAPVKTPPAVIARLNKEANRILERPEVKKNLAMDGAEPAGGTPEDAMRSAREESAKWGKLIKQLDFRP